MEQAKSTTNTSRSGKKKTNANPRRKKLKNRKQLDDQHSKAQLSSAHDHPVKVNNSSKTKKSGAKSKICRAKNFHQKYDQDLDMTKKFTAADLGTYTVPAFKKQLPLAEQNKLMRQMFGLPVDCDMNLIKDRIQDGETLLKEKGNGLVFSTGFDQLDDMLRYKGIATGEILEFCGYCGVGKTSMILTILINILAENEDEEVVYIDTKDDFCAQLLVDFLRARQMSEEKVFDVISRFKVVQVAKLPDLLSYLDGFITPQSMEQAEEIDNVRFIVVDSITVPFYQLSSSMIEHNEMIVSIVHSKLKQLSRRGFTVRFEYQIITPNVLNHFYFRSSCQMSDSTSTRLMP
jgi:hypothetical protein